MRPMNIVDTELAFEPRKSAPIKRIAERPKNAEVKKAQCARDGVFKPVIHQAGADRGVFRVRVNKRNEMVGLIKRREVNRGKSGHYFPTIVPRYKKTRVITMHHFA